MAKRKVTQLNRSGRIIRTTARFLNDKELNKGSLGRRAYTLLPGPLFDSVVDSNNFKEFYCVRGAMSAAHFGSDNIKGTYHDTQHNLAAEDLLKYLKDSNSEFEKHPNIENWNDHSGLSKDEIVAWMHKFADWADPQGLDT